MSKDYSLENCHAACMIYSLIFRHGKVPIPKQIQKSLVERHHKALFHPGETGAKKRQACLFTGDYNNRPSYWL